ncbi:helix-turn-helix domain-containing protein [Jannaschia sp. W003]|uniref:winged helix-turn-helix transcriptional regulator n=1 Tax=Jannaschia sp. W003 TaxID=2867012 RepID=UPI0021A79487|nr:helix-turn-helix domain-containing protein [Jannaschia sp. W003]UWQ21137.1 helix-turn-helix transcriptional regulator [Jannaschia sp. W003]
MPNAGYKQFCPVAMAAEILCTRWTVLVIRELIAGSTRFNDLRRGVPKMSRTLLAQRLRELEEQGIVARRAIPGDRIHSEYRLTDAGRDLLPVVEAFGRWGQKWVESRISLRNLDPSLLMWDMRRNIDPAPLPPRRAVVQFRYPELPPAQRDFWMVVEPSGEVDLCSDDPGFEVDLMVTTDLRTMTAIWMGLTTVRAERARIAFDGDGAIAARMQTWLGLSPFATAERAAS